MPDNTPDDEVADRLAANAARFGLDLSAPTGAFGDRVDEAMVHAAESARADPQAASRPWAPLGPRNVGGRVPTLVQDPLSPRTFWAGSSFGGLWKTEDAGETWAPVSSFLERDSNPGLADKDVAVPVGAIGLCHRSPATLYVGTGELRSSAFTGTGLWMSTDAGAHFTRIAEVSAGPLRALGYERIEVDPWTPGRCWIACHLGLFRREPSIAGPGPNLVQDRIDTADAPAVQDVTDVAIDFGDRAAAAPPGPFTIHVGLRGDTAANPGGIFRARFDPATNAYLRSDPANPASPVWTRATGAALPFPVAGAVPAVSSGPGRIRLALCEKAPQTVYAVVGLGTGAPSRVFRSTDGGASFAQTAERPGENSTIAWYALMLACHPEDPRIAFTGSTDIFRTVDGGASWTKVLDFTRFEAGERAQHADQHAFLFDRRDPRRVWSGNDGGISESRNLGLAWRKRSFGIVAAQFYDLAIHPTYPFVMGGGLQDNGSWLTYGGLSWLQCGRADGGAFAFQPGATDIFLASHQGNTVRGEVQLTFLPTLRPASGTFGWQGNGDLFGNWLADRPTGTGPSGETTYPYAVMNVQNFTPGVQAVHTGTIFGRKLEGHPVRPDVFLTGWTGAAYGVASGSLAAAPPATPTLTFGLLATGAFSPAGAQVSALAFAPTRPAVAPSPNSDTTWWVGTTGGEVFFTVNGGTSWTNATARLVLAGHAGAEITGFSAHPANPALVVVSTAAVAPNVFLSADATAVTAGAASSTWRAISHAAPAPAAGAPQLDLPRAAVARAVIDPTSPATSDAANRQTIHAATVAGVYVCRNATVDTSVAPVWRTFSAGMPLVLVADLDHAESYAADGTTVTRRVLRAATFGRGIWECDLDAAPAPRLLLRSTPIDDGFRYFGTQTFAHDPRLNTPGSPPVPLDRRRAIDIRVDPPPYSVFGEALDAVEFDEEFRSGTLVTGEPNFIHVQVQNRGAVPVAEAFVHLYFADAPGTPPVAPALDADFWTRFPNEPLLGRVWQRAGSVTVRDIRPDRPRIARLEWVPPVTLGGQVAILAVASSVQDDLGALRATLPLAVEPDAAGTSLTAVERRAALLVTPARRTVPDVFVRDGVGDTGEPGAIAWGGRSADIVVVQAPEPDPDAAFGPISDTREGDRIRAGVDNLVHVRLFNRSAAPVTATLDLFFVPMGAVADRSAWRRIGARTTVPDIPPRGHRFSPAIPWPAAEIPDPAPAGTVKAHVLIALIGTGEDPVPDASGIATLAGFWEFFLAGTAANNAAFRALRYLPEGAVA